MRRTLTNTMLLGCTILFAACGDQLTAPAGPQLAPLPPTANVYVNSYTSGPDATEADFTVTPSGGWFKLGANSIYFPANSICDPAKSTYGVTQWEAPCTPATTPIQIHARLNKDDDLVEFTPELRFVPANDSKKWVYLYVSSSQLSQQADQTYNRGGDSRTQASDDNNYQNTDGAQNQSSKFTLLWLPEVGADGIDESVTDSSLKTHTDAQRGLVYRRLKHFSAYQVVVGFRADVESALDY